MITRLHHVTWLLIALPIISGSSEITTTENEGDFVPVVIDSDGGADDAFGIFLFLWSENNRADMDFDTRTRSGGGMKLKAVTTVAGFTNVKNATRNVQAILEVAGRTDIPVYAGASRGLTAPAGPSAKDDWWMEDGSYGRDGFGNFLPPVINATSDHQAVDRLVELSKWYEGSLHIICLGPLTNIGLAQRRDPLFLRRVKKINIMGGTVSGRGNMRRHGVEFNTYMDPEAANIVFLETSEYPYNKSITVMPYDPVATNQISKNWRINVLGKLNSTRINFLNKAESTALSSVMPAFWSSPDSQAVATAVFPNLISQSLLTNVLVETGGVHARGAMLVDYKYGDRSDRIQNAFMIQKIDKSYYQQLLILAFKD